MAILMRSAAEPWMGVLTAMCSPLILRPMLVEWISGISRLRPRMVETISLLPGQFHHFGREFLDAGIFGEIILDEFLGFRHGDPVFPGQPLGTHPIDDPEVDGLGLVALGGGHLVHGNPENEGGRAAVDILVVLEGLRSGSGPR